MHLRSSCRGLPSYAEEREICALWRTARSGTIANASAQSLYKGGKRRNPFARGLTAPRRLTIYRGIRRYFVGVATGTERVKHCSAVVCAVASLQQTPARNPDSHPPAIRGGTCCTGIATRGNDPGRYSRVIPSFFMRLRSVLGCNARIFAAPLGPSMTQRVRSRAATI